MSDHIRRRLSIPPPFNVARTVGFMKGKSAARIHRQYPDREYQSTGFHFGARGHCVSTIGLDEQFVRQ
jgi:putative transposase